MVQQRNSETSGQVSAETWSDDHETEFDNGLEVGEDDRDQLPEWKIIEHNLGI